MPFQAHFANDHRVSTPALTRHPVLPSKTVNLTRCHPGHACGVRHPVCIQQRAVTTSAPSLRATSPHRHTSRTLCTAESKRLACCGSWMWRSIMDAARMMAVGLATSLPAMSMPMWRAPCSKMVAWVPMFAPGTTPGPPVNPATAGRQAGRRCLHERRSLTFTMSLTTQYSYHWKPGFRKSLGSP